MPNRFKPGQEVVCIHDFMPNPLNRPGPMEGEIVTIKRYLDIPGFRSWGPIVELVEYPPLESSTYARAWREVFFEPLTDISELKEVLNQIEEHA